MADLNDYANQIDDYCRKWKIHINPEKCELLKISGIKKLQSSRTNRLVKKASIEIKGRQVKPVKSLKYLGVSFNERYDFNDHAKLVIKRASIASNSLNRLFRHSQMKQNVKTTMYKTLVRPTMTNAFSAWSKISSAQMEQIRLKERKLLRQIHIERGRKRDSNHHVNNKTLYDETGVSRFDRVVTMQAIRFRGRLLEMENNRIISEHLLDRREGDGRFKHPAHLYDEFVAGTLFDEENNLSIFHRSHRGDTMVYNQLQNQDDNGAGFPV